MRAATIEEGKIAVGERPDLRPGTGEVLVRVRAAGLNGADQLQVIGLYPPPAGSGLPADIPGLEIAGEVAGLGDGVSRFAVGDRVMAITAGAAHAELALTHERQLMPVPDGLSWSEAGGFPEVFSTAYDALFTQGRLRPGERLLVHGAAGGVGTAAIQLAASLGAHVTATVRNPAARDAVAALGADLVIAPEDAGAHGEFDVILELVGGPNMPGNVRSLAIGGRIVVIGMAAGATTELNLFDLMSRRGTISASSLRGRPLEEKALLARRLESHVLPLLREGRLRVPVAATYALDQVADAYRHFAEGGKTGKIVLSLP